MITPQIIATVAQALPVALCLIAAIVNRKHIANELWD